MQFDSIEFVSVNRSSALKDEVKLNVNNKNIETMIEVWNLIVSNEDMHEENLMYLTNGYR